MSTIATASPREIALAPYLRRLPAELQDLAARSLSDGIDDPWPELVGPAPSAWEHEQILLDARSDARTSAATRLVSRCFALQSKARADASAIAALRGSSGPDFFALQAELMLDVAIGTALLRQARQGFVGPGDAVSRVVDRLNRIVASTGRLVTESQRQRAQSLAGDLVESYDAPNPRGAGAPGAGTRVEEAPQEWARWSKARPRTPGAVKAAAATGAARRPRRSMGLTGALAAAQVGLLVIWAITTWDASHRQAAAPAAASLSVETDRVFTRAFSMPPSLYVTVSAPEWDRLDDDTRDRRIRALVASLPETIRGALFRTGDGRTVARWLRDRGAERIAAMESGEVAASRGASH